MVNAMSLFIDRLAELEEKEGRMGSIVGILGLLVMFIAGVSLVVLGINMMMYFGVEIINKIFF